MSNFFRPSKAFTSFVLVICSVLLSFGQQTNFQNYSVGEGLPFIHVYVIHQDPNGVLWSGGYGGLSRFDGSNFKNYSPQDGLLDHHVTSIVTDTSGILWVGTIVGISTFDGISFTNYTIEDGLPADFINEIEVDINGRIWIATDGGLCYFENGSFKTLKNKEDILNRNIDAIESDANGHLWIASDSGIYSLHLNADESAQLTQVISTEASITNKLFADENQNIWVTSDQGLTKIIHQHGNSEQDQNTITINYTTKDGLPSNNITDVAFDRSGKIWVGSPDGLSYMEDGKFIPFEVEKSSQGNWIECLFKDSEQNLWLGTYNGLYRFRGGHFSNFNTQDGLSNDFIFPIVRDTMNRLWVGTSGGGLNKIVNGDIQHYQSSVTNKHQFVHVALKEDDRIYFGTDQGIIYLDNSGRADIHFTDQNYTNEEHGPVVTALFKDSKERYWIGGHGYVCWTYDLASEVDPRNVFQIPAGDRSQVWVIHEDHLGDILIGTYVGGLLRFDGESLTQLQIGKRNHSYLAICQDTLNNYWLGTFNGVIMFDGEKSIQFNMKDGLKSDLVYSLKISRSKRDLWIGTNQGLHKMDLDEYYRSGDRIIDHFGKNEGFSGVECNSNGILEDIDGTFWFGTVNGLIKYSPEEDLKNYELSKTSITGITIFYNDTILPQNSVLEYDQNQITFEFVGICLTNPSKVRYRYMLSPQEDKWSPETEDNDATYSNLDPGKYTFKVISSNNEGMWNTEPAQFTFTINTPYWKTKWFRISIISLFIILIATSIWLYVRNLKFTNDRQRRMELLKSEALRSQMNPHFLFNAMNTIQHYINNNEKRMANRYLTNFAELMRMVLSNSQKEEVTLEDDLRSLELYLQLEVKRFEDKFEYVIDIESALDIHHIMIPPLIIQPYVENAIQHGLLNKAEKGCVWVRIKKENNFIICTIEDNGIGRQKAMELAKIRKSTHRSAGMNITSNRIQTHNSLLGFDLSINLTDLKDENGAATGTRVQIYIPLTEEHV